MLCRRSFSSHDSECIEQHYLAWLATKETQGKRSDEDCKAQVLEDHLFEVDFDTFSLSPSRVLGWFTLVYWEGPVSDVRRGIWFYSIDATKYVPCDDNLTQQIEIGFKKHKPWLSSEELNKSPTRPEWASDDKWNNGRNQLYLGRIWIIILCFRVTR